MPIVEITEDSIRQHCNACQQRRDLPHEQLTFTGEADGPDTGILAVPPCTCGATEFLVRAPADEPAHPQPGSFGHRHRLLVDALVDALRARRDDEGVVVAAKVNGLLGAELLAEWFSDGLRAEPESTVPNEPVPADGDNPSDACGDE